MASKKKKEEKHKCAECSEEAYLRGYNFLLGKKDDFDLDNMKKEYHWWCKEHYLANMFGLWPYKCTKECDAKVKKGLYCKPLKGDLWIWVPLERIVAARKKTILKCPACRKPLSAVPLYKKRPGKG